MVFITKSIIFSLLRKRKNKNEFFCCKMAKCFVLIEIAYVCLTLHLGNCYIFVYTQQFHEAFHLHNILKAITLTGRLLSDPQMFSYLRYKHLYIWRHNENDDNEL